jgi:hypothetical protein
MKKDGCSENILSGSSVANALIIKSSEVLPAELLTSIFEVLMIRTLRTRSRALIKKGLRGLLIFNPFRFLASMLNVWASSSIFVSSST